MLANGSTSYVETASVDMKMNDQAHLSTQVLVDICGEYLTSRLVASLDLGNIDSMRPKGIVN